MFDIFATILSAGVVISVVTLVVHEPLLLAAGISTILGLMFVLLPAFVAMVPMLGYLLMFTGAVLLGYGVISTRSWLNALEAKRVAALTRRRTLAAARTRQDGDSDLRLASRLTTLATTGSKPAAGGHPGRPRPLTGDDDSRVESAPVRGPAATGGDSPRGRGLPDGGQAMTGSALGRLGRSLARTSTGLEPVSGTSRPPLSTRPGLPTRPGSRIDEIDLAPKPSPRSVITRDVDDDNGDGRPAQPSAPAPATAPTPVPAPTAAAGALVAAPVPPPAARSPLKAADKPKGRGAERIEQIKAESRQASQTRRRRPASPGTGESPNSQARPAGVTMPMETPAIPPLAPPLSAPPTQPPDALAAADRRSRRERDLMELGLREQVLADVDDARAERPGTKPFLARLARRS